MTPSELLKAAEKLVNGFGQIVSDYVLAEMLWSLDQERHSVDYYLFAIDKIRKG